METKGSPKKTSTFLSAFQLLLLTTNKNLGIYGQREKMKKNHEKIFPISLGIITVSSTRTKETDISGLIIKDLLSKVNITCNYYDIVPDKKELIIEKLKQALKSVNCIITHGGTGLTYDDCTIEAIRPLFEKEIEGFGEIFRYLSFLEIGSAAMLSRATAGIFENKLIFCIPGSQKAVQLATEKLIIPEIRHILSHILP